MSLRLKVGDGIFFEQVKVYFMDSHWETNDPIGKNCFFAIIHREKLGVHNIGLNIRHKRGHLKLKALSQSVNYFSSLRVWY